MQASRLCRLLQVKVSRLSSFSFTSQRPRSRFKHVFTSVCSEAEEADPVL